MSLRLESHCRSRLVLPPWARCGGFTNTDWCDDDDAESSPVAPTPGRDYRLHAGPPFEAAERGRFLTLWLPPLVVHNGWVEEDAPLLCDIRVVECVLLNVVRASSRERYKKGMVLAVHVLSSEDPMSIFRRSEPIDTDLAGCLLDAPATGLVTDDRRFVRTSMQGDINFEYLLDPTGESVALVLDTSICQGFFRCGHGRLTEHARLALTQAREHITQAQPGA